MCSSMAWQDKLTFYDSVNLRWLVLLINSIDVILAETNQLVYSMMVVSH